jgi:hypothetical protein
VRARRAPFLATLPRTTLTPMLWPAAQRGALLKGSPVRLFACMLSAHMTRAPFR